MRFRMANESQDCSPVMSTPDNHFAHICVKTFAWCLPSIDCFPQMTAIYHLGPSKSTQRVIVVLNFRTSKFRVVDWNARLSNVFKCVVKRFWMFTQWSAGTTNGWCGRPIFKPWQSFLSAVILRKCHKFLAFFRYAFEWGIKNWPTQSARG